MAECAVWYWQHQFPNVEWFDDEQSAARFALNMEDEGNGSVRGVQYADGRFVGADAWSELDAEQQRQMEAWRRGTDSAARPVRVVVPPFDARGLTVTVDADAPSWLGAQ